MFKYCAFCVNAHKTQCLMVGDAHSPEKCLGRGVGASHADLFFHTPYQQEKTLSTVWTFWYRLFHQIFFAPKGLASIDHCLDLSAQSKKEYGRGEYDPISCAYSRINLDHIIVYYAFATLLA